MAESALDIGETRDALAMLGRPAAVGGETVFCLRVFAAVASGLAAVFAFAPRWITNRRAPHHPSMVADRWLGNWLRWDGWWYVNIAAHGYTYRPHRMSAVAFFPVYPLVVRTVSGTLPGGVGLSAIVVTALCGCVALVLFHRWCATRLPARPARTALVLLALYPFAWFLYGAAYSDALFLCLVLGAFLLVDSDHPLAAGIVGAVATATRPTGITLVIGLVAVMADRRGLLHRGTRGNPRGRDWLVLTSIAGLAAWCIWLMLRFGNPFAFVETEGAPGWDQGPGLHTWLKVGFPHAVASSPAPVAVALVVQAVACFAFLAATPAIARTFGRGYAIYAVAAIVIPAVSTADFLGVGRYLLACFPVFAVAGAAIDRRAMARIAVPVASAVALVVFASVFASGYLVS